MSDSPFLHNTHVQFAWDSTSLGWLKTCPRLYQYSMIDGWRPKGTGLHFIFGQWYHAGLELYDKLRAADTSLSHDDALIEVVQRVLIWTWETDPAPGKPWESGDPNKNRETLVRSIIWYLDHFNYLSPDPAKTVILANGKPAVELSFRFELPFGPALGQPYVICGHLDRVVEFGDGNFVMDRKTTKATTTSHYFEQYSPDNQMTLYTLAAQVIYSTPVKGVIIDAAQIAVGFTRFARGFTFRTKSDIEEWLEEFKVWTGIAEMYARANYWPRNDKACHHFGGCTFRGVCSKTPEMRETFLKSGFEKRPWNPLEVR